MARRKIHVDDGGYFDWTALCEVRAIAPAPDRVDGRATEHPVAAQNAGRNDQSVLRDDGLQDHLAFKSGDSGEEGVVGRGR